MVSGKDSSPKEMADAITTSSNEENSATKQPWLGNRNIGKTVVVALVALFVLQFLNERAQYLGRMRCNSNNKDSNFDIRIPGIDDTISVDPCLVYSNTYEEARAKFRQAVEKLNNSGSTSNLTIELHILPVQLNPINNDNRYKEEEDEDEYTIDVAVINHGSNHNLVVHSSGVHGIEGFAGSAIQIGYMNWLSNIDHSNELIINNTLVIIHAVNPFGMKNFRRANENNVDLNRNGIIDFEQHMLDVAKRTQIDTALDAGSFLQRYVLDPGERKPASLYETYVGIPVLAAKELLTKGYFAIKKTLVQGQYTYPKGLFYGGNKLQPSLILVRDWFLREQPKLFDASTNITWLDVHTGLGKKGIDVLFPSKFTISDRSLMEEAQRCFPQHKKGIESFEANPVNRGYENAKGFVIDYFAEAVFSKSDSKASTTLKPKVNLIGLGQEIGSLTPSILVAHGMIVENLGYHFYKRFPFRRNLRLALSEFWMKRSNYLEFDNKWRHDVLNVGITLLHQAIVNRGSTTLTSTNHTIAKVGKHIGHDKPEQTIKEGIIDHDDSSSHQREKQKDNGINNNIQEEKPVVSEASKESSHEKEL